MNRRSILKSLSAGAAISAVRVPKAVDVVGEAAQPEKADQVTESALRAWSPSLSSISLLSSIYYSRAIHIDSEVVQVGEWVSGKTVRLSRGR